MSFFESCRVASNLCNNAFSWIFFDNSNSSSTYYFTCQRDLLQDKIYETFCSSLTDFSFCTGRFMHFLIRFLKSNSMIIDLYFSAVLEVGVDRLPLFNYFARFIQHEWNTFSIHWELLPAIESVFFMLYILYFRFQLNLLCSKFRRVTGCEDFLQQFSFFVAYFFFCVSPSRSSLCLFLLPRLITLVHSSNPKPIRELTCFLLTIFEVQVKFADFDACFPNGIDGILTQIQVFALFNACAFSVFSILGMSRYLFCDGWVSRCQWKEHCFQFEITFFP